MALLEKFQPLFQEDLHFEFDESSGRLVHPLYEDKPVKGADEIVHEFEGLTADEIFEQISDYTRSVLTSSKEHIAVLAGDPGAGKSRVVEAELQKNGFKKVNSGNHAIPLADIRGKSPEEVQKIMEAAGQALPFKKEYVYGSQKITRAALYAELFNNRDRVLIYDDSDTILTDPENVGLLKLALNSEPVRTLSHGSRKPFVELGKDVGVIPKSFQYSGKIIILSNLYFKDIDPAILSRARAVEIDFTPEQIMERFHKILPDIHKENPDISLTSLYEVFSWVHDLMIQKRILDKFDLRTFISLARDYGSMDRKKWEKYALQQIKTKYPGARYTIRVPQKESLQESLQSQREIEKLVGLTMQTLETLGHARSQDKDDPELSIYGSDVNYKGALNDFYKNWFSSIKIVMRKAPGTVRGNYQKRSGLGEISRYVNIYTSSDPKEALRSPIEKTEIRNSLVHEFTHAYDDYISKGKYASKDSPKSKEDSLGYLQSNHEVNARYTAAVDEIRNYKLIDPDNKTRGGFENYLWEFKQAFLGWADMKPEVQKSLTNRLYKDYSQLRGNEVGLAAEKAVSSAFWHPSQISGIKTDPRLGDFDLKKKLAVVVKAINSGKLRGEELKKRYPGAWNAMLAAKQDGTDDIQRYLGVSQEAFGSIKESRFDRLLARRGETREDFEKLVRFQPLFSENADLDELITIQIDQPETTGRGREQDPYMQGMANGMLLAKYTVEDLKSEVPFVPALKPFDPLFKENTGCLMVDLSTCVDDLSVFNGIQDLIPAEALYISETEDHVDGLEDMPHVTVMYGIHDGVEIPDRVVTRGEVRFRIGNLTAFRNADKPFDVLKLDVISDSLCDLHNEFKTLPNSWSYKQYCAHITVGYVVKGWGQHLEGACPWTGAEYVANQLRFTSDVEPEKTVELIPGHIAVDLDKTLATYYGPDMIGEPIPEMVARVQGWLQQGIPVKIFTARAVDSEQIGVVREWVQKNIGTDLEITNEKTPETLEIWDDKAINPLQESPEVKYTLLVPKQSGPRAESLLKGIYEGRQTIGEEINFWFQNRLEYDEAKELLDAEGIAYRVFTQTQPRLLERGRRKKLLEDFHAVKKNFKEFTTNEWTDQLGKTPKKTYGIRKQKKGRMDSGVEFSGFNVHTGIISFRVETTDDAPSMEMDHRGKPAGDTSHYTVEIKLDQFKDWASEREWAKMSVKEFKEILDVIDVKVWCSCPFFFLGGIAYQLSQMDSAIYPVVTPDARWSRYTAPQPSIEKHVNAVLVKMRRYPEKILAAIRSSVGGSPAEFKKEKPVKSVSVDPITTQPPEKVEIEPKTPPEEVVDEIEFDAVGEEPGGEPESPVETELEKEPETDDKWKHHSWQEAWKPLFS